MTTIEHEHVYILSSKCILSLIIGLRPHRTTFGLCIYLTYQDRSNTSNVAQEKSDVGKHEQVTDNNCQFVSLTFSLEFIHCGALRGRGGGGRKVF